DQGRCRDRRHQGRGDDLSLYQRQVPDRGLQELQGGRLPGQAPGLQSAPGRAREASGLTGGRVRVEPDQHMRDTSPETAFDDLARLAASICATPIALISLTDREPGWCAARIGLEASAAPPDAAFVSLAAAGSDLLVVEDAAADPRFSADPLVTSGPRIRFYAGLSLVSHDGGHVLGALSVMDPAPRGLEPGQREALRALGRQAVAQLEI